MAPGAPADIVVPVGDGNHVVAEGEGLSSIAAAYGFFWATLRELPENAALAAARPNPEVLLPGDRVTVPAPRPHAVRCATGKRHVFRRKGVPSKVCIRIRTSDGVVFGGCKYLFVAGGQEIEGTTDDDGMVEEWVDPLLQTAQLTVWLGNPLYPETYVTTLTIGKLQPPGTLAGIQSRLINLGYDLGDERGTLGPRTQAALRDVQTRSGLPVDGVPDDATRAAVQALHGA